MVHLLYLYDVNDRHGHVYVDGDVDVVHFVKAERSNLLVVVVLYIQIRGGKQDIKRIKSAFMKINLQLSSSLWSKQLDVWSHLPIKNTVTDRKAHFVGKRNNSRPMIWLIIAQC